MPDASPHPQPSPHDAPRARWLSSEVWRHTVGMGVALAPIAAWFLTATVRGEPIERLPNLALTLTSLGLYGPLYLALSAWTLRHRRGEALRHELRATRPPRGWKGALLAFGPRSWGAFVVVLALLGVIALSLTRSFVGNPWLVASAGVAIVGGWVLLVGVFAIEYARLWADRRALRFPDDDDSTRSLADFVYLSVQVATTFATSDVAVTNTRARATVTVQTIVGYVYTTGIMALFVSFLLSGLSGGASSSP